ncbi:MAG: DUF222 domain-containing protein [Dermatophilaceae bacterium]|mgnify:CR=1 FL=1
MPNDLLFRPGNQPGAAPETGLTGAVGAREVAEVRALVAEATAALTGLREVLWQSGGGALAEILGELGELALITDAAEVAVIAETLTRGEHQSGPVPLAVGDWVSAHSRRYPNGTMCAKPVRLAQHITKRVISDRLAECVLTGAAPIAAASVAAAEMLRLLPDLQPGFVPAGWDAYADLAAAGDPSEVRRLRPALIARYGKPDELAKNEKQVRSRASLSRGYDDGGSLIDYRMSLDPESAAVLESALGPLTTPIPGPDGEPDTRSWSTRRANALIELISRAVRADDGVVGRSSTHTTVLVRLADLASGAGAGESTGTCDAGRFLSIPTVRALSCAGQITPIVLDTHGNPILIGRTKRLFTAAQVAALIVRDGGCTFPGCTRPPNWTDAHHLVHWIDGGTTDLDNAALLCRMHHTTVHSRHLAGRVTHGPPGDPDEHRLRVLWDTTPGSYDHARTQAIREPTTAA